MMSSDLLEPFVMPVVLALVALFAAWIYYGARRLWPQKPLAEGRIYRCAACGHVYVEGRDVPMSRCPRCDRINEAVRR